jgi:ADP-ribosylglycohydrolase
LRQVIYASLSPDKVRLMNIMIEKPNSISLELYRKKVLGCWLGKAIGGTLGGPAEGKTGPLSLTYYDPVPDQMLPNDDLDLQVVWLEAIRRKGLPVDRRLLAEAWLEHIHLWPDEYGVASRNLAQSIYPPASGSFDNGFTAGMGAAIRTEIWACLAPGDPVLAASLAREDACVDHAYEGVYAAEFLAAIESAAFLESDSSILLDTGISMIPENCRVAGGMKTMTG